MIITEAVNGSCATCLEVVFALVLLFRAGLDRAGRRHHGLERAGRMRSPPTSGCRRRCRGGSLAIMHVAMFEAMNAIERRYKPYRLELVADRKTSRRGGRGERRVTLC